MVDLGFTKTTEDNNPQVSKSLISEGIYIFAGNDVIIYSQSAANSINLFILGHVRVAINVRSISKRFKVLGRAIQVLHFLLRNPLDIFAP